MTFTGGVDIGSTETKCILIDEDREIVSRGLVNTAGRVKEAGEKVLKEALSDAPVTEDNLEVIIGTGYGRYNVTAGDDQITEITCHARGAVHMFPETRTVLDMGGQDTKAISVAENGEVLDFCMNDKCAAGTGRFLGGAADALDISLDELGPTSLEGNRPVDISSTCTVFAESEILSHLSKGQKIENILKGVHEAIALRSFGLLKRVGIREEVTFTGGVSRNIGMRKAMEEVLELELNVSEESQFMGALGAALYAMDRIQNTSRETVKSEKSETE